MDPVFFCHYVPGLHQLIPLMEELGGVMWTDDSEVVRAARSCAPHLNVRRFLLGSQRWVSRRAGQMRGDVFLGANAHSHFFNRVSGPRVQCFHGVSSKGFAAQWRNTRYFDLCLLAGERMRQAFERAGLTERTPCEVVGYIHGDKLTHGQYDGPAFRRQHGLAEHAPTVLYAPTWSGLSSFNEHGLEIAQAVPPHWNLMVKLHPWTVRRREAPRMLRAVRSFLHQRANSAMLPHGMDIYPLMAAADLMIGDRSSTCEEWLLLNRPIIFFDHLTSREITDPDTRTLVQRGDWSDLHRCGPVVGNGPQLREALKEQHLHPEEHAPERIRMRNFVFHQPDGNATKRAAAAVRQLAEESRERVFGQRFFE